jgi:hypothetical protein
MSEYDQHGEERREHPQATVHTAKYTPWLWLIPALAVFFVGYLIVRYGFFGGGDITCISPRRAGSIDTARCVSGVRKSELCRRSPSTTSSSRSSCASRWMRP